MQSINFEFLRATWPELAGLGGFAESYAHGDPIGAIAKLRAFCEQASKFIHHRLKLPRLIRPNLIDLLDDSAFQSAVPRVVVSKLHALRIEGNQAVHGNRGDTTTALRLLKEAYDLGRWLYVNFAAGRVEDCPPFTPPPEGGAEAAQRRREKRAILERIAAQEAQMQELLEKKTAQDPEAGRTQAKRYADGLEAVRRIVESFGMKRRKGLIVMATGTGKTRVAIALCDALIQACWAKRILLLYDRTKRIYLATYPAMIKIFHTFDPGFFDLIIADESHRSLYNRYRQLFDYYDCYQVGLTATPIDFVAKSTFDMFQCGTKDPTFNYSFEEAIEFEQAEVDRQIFNKDTNRIILRNLMEHVIRVADGSRLGKTIIFARNHNHAVLLQNLFDELYPQYGVTSAA